MRAAAGRSSCRARDFSSEKGAAATAIESGVRGPICRLCARIHFPLARICPFHGGWRRHGVGMEKPNNSARECTLFGLSLQGHGPRCQARLRGRRYRGGAVPEQGEGIGI